eukprot:CAMPEP_0204626090 /NCGR_PEP_ID=MMETSP0717-20131115/11714_1 /ASSEMBLY_ACC=CAM_ASM_000666 /TAXON_ID=230516 /ORGANISM="Chaetoceros curvisetus" /LENGTH=232 /DNA_ID=CAMNT_0051641929 /DNA_START=277 /DNA_END=975 /DNA_ORIENTATION=-
MNLINHKPTGRGANVKLAWSNASYHNDGFLEHSVEDLMEDADAILGLGMDIIATEDIKAGEEVFLDYGPEWQTAFEEHSKNWNYDKQWPKQADELNAESNPFPTNKERKEIMENGGEDPIPENIMTSCFLKAPTSIENGVSVFEFDEKKKYDGDHLQVCEVIEREIGPTEDDLSSYVYTVRIREGVQMVTKVPHDFIMYFDQPYKSLLHAPGTFRHPIMIPSDIFPETWLDL